MCISYYKIMYSLKEVFKEGGEMLSLHVFQYGRKNRRKKEEIGYFFPTYTVRAVRPGHFQVLLYQLLL